MWVSRRLREGRGGRCGTCLLGVGFFGVFAPEMVVEGYGVEMQTLELERILEQFCLERRTSARPWVLQSQDWQSRSR